MPQPVLKQAARETPTSASSISAPPARPCTRRWTAAGTSGMHIDALRLRAFPFSAAVAASSPSTSGVRGRAEPRRADAQAADQRAGDRSRRKLMPVLHYDGTPITARFIIEAIAKRVRADNVEPIRAKKPRERPSHDLHRQAQLHHPTLPTNKLGFTRRDYEGKISTLCAGCGHDSISAALIRPAGSWTSSRTASPSCRASAARRRRPTTSSAHRTASTPCTGACPRS